MKIQKNQKMSDEKWEKARQMRISGSTLQEIANEFGISKQRVEQVLNGVGPRAINRKLFPKRAKCIFPRITKYMDEKEMSLNKFAFDSGLDYYKIRSAFSGRTELRMSEINTILRVTGMTYEEAFKTKEESE